MKTNSNTRKYRTHDVSNFFCFRGQRVYTQVKCVFAEQVEQDKTSLELEQKKPSSKFCTKHCRDDMKIRQIFLLKRRYRKKKV